jgi:hypothetical protein
MAYCGANVRSRPKADMPTGLIQINANPLT